MFVLGLTIAGCVPSEDPVAAGTVEVSLEGVADVLALEDPLLRSERLARLLQRAEASDADMLTHAFERAVLPQMSSEYALFGTWWAGFDPKAAFNYVNHSLSMEHPAVILAVVREWARRDPMGALESELLNEQGRKTPALRESLAQVFVSGWFESGKPGLEDWIISQPDPLAIEAAFRHYAQMRVARDGAETTLEWAKSAPFEQVDRRSLIRGALEVIAHREPALAAEWLPQAESMGMDAKNLMGPISKGWSHHDPGAAADWLLSFPETAARNAALRPLIARWIRRDHEAFIAWLDENEQRAPGWLAIYRANAIRTYVNHQDYRMDWLDVMAEIDKVKEPITRSGIRLWVLKRWKAADSEGAEAWVEANPEHVDLEMRKKMGRLSAKERERIDTAVRYDR